jgi:hypothetical protein
MSFRTILVPIEQHDLMNSTLETAFCLAQKFDCYIEGFTVRVASPAADWLGDVLDRLALSSVLPSNEIGRGASASIRANRSLTGRCNHIVNKSLS